MSKHLLYRKDLPNRTLTCSFLFVLAQLIACLIVLIPAVSPAEAAGPLTFKTTSPRYFFDSTGKSVYLTGSYLDEYNTLSVSWDFASYLDFLQQQKQNFTRVWGWEQSPWIYDKTGQIAFSTQPYQRTGPGLALDGALKFDLTRFNQAYFDQLRARVVEASRRGIYVSVMLFEGFSTQKQIGRVNPWLGDPFQQANNINGVTSDPNRNGGGEEFFSLAFPSLLTLQETFVRKVVDTLNDLDNVLYEVSGNGLTGSLSWQYRMIDYIKGYQAKKANQHPVGISDFYAGAIAEVFNSSADWIVVPETNLNLPPGTSNKVLVMEGTPVISGDQVFSTSPISLLQLLPEGVTSTQSPSISNTVPSSNGVTPSSSSATSSTLNATTSSSNSQQSKVAAPTITPNGGIYSGRVSVTLETPTPGASIYYTTDGQSPTQSSRPYTGKFPLSDSTLVKAKAFKSNFEPSSEASAWFANAAVSEPSLVAHWKFDEGTGTTASDSSGNGNTGTLINGPLWTAGKIGNGLFFDGIDDNVTVADSNSLDLSSSFTLSAWVNPASTFTDFRSILVKNYRYYFYASVAGYCGNGNPLAGFYEATNKTACQPSPLPINTWTHLAVTYNGSTLTLYRNGVAVITSTASGTPSLNIGTLQIGASQFGEYFKGLIDEVRVYSRALSDSGIQALYQQQSVETSQTVAAAASQPFSFSLTNSGDKSVVAGASVTNSISTTLSSGKSQTVSFSVSGLPAGATGSFSSPSCSPACSSTMTINTTASTPAGSSIITVTATGGGITKTTTFSLTTSLPTVATPTISPNGGSFTGSVSVTMQTAISGASIYYTTNGSTPTQSSTLYTGAMPLTSSSTVKAKAFKSGYNPSAEASGSFIVSQPFNFSLANSGDKSVVAGSSVTNSIGTTLASGSAQAVSFSASGLPTGATGSFSAASCSPACSSTMTINTTTSTPAGSSIITVTATGGGITKTTTFSLTTSLPTVAAPAISPNGGSYTGSIPVTMQTATSGASIYYTTNGSTPTQSSTLYSGALTLTSSATVKAKAFKNGFNSSAEASASFTVAQPFGFSLANSGNKSVTAGFSVTNSISTTLSSGSSQAVSFSVSGLPAGATGSFSSASCSPACSTGLNINTTGSTPVGNFPVTVSAAGGGVSKTTVFTLTVSVAPVATTPTLNVSPTAVAVGSMVTATWNGIVAPSSTDWIGLYTPSAADTNFISWMYVSCTKTASNAQASGSCSYTLPATLAAGNYELRLFSNDGYTRLATSKSFSVAPVVTTPVLNVSPTTVNPGTAVTAGWTGITAPTPMDWIGLYAPSAADTNFISWMYVSCTKTASNAQASGSCPYTLPATLAAGNYELRFFSNDGYTRLATSTSFSVALAATVSSPTVTAPTISPNGGSYAGSISVTMQTTTSGASIYYTTNGAAPTQSSTLYTGAMTLTSSATVKAKAFKSGSTASAEVSASFTVGSSGTAKGVTRYTDNLLSSNCTSGNYSIANRNCSGSDGNAYTTIQAAASGLGPGDRVYVRASSTVYAGTAEANAINLSSLGTGTSGNHLVVQKYPGDSASTVYVRAIRGGGSPSSPKNVTFRDMTINCGNFTTPSAGQQAGASTGIFEVNGARFENVVVENCWRVGIQFVGQSQFINMTVRFNGYGIAGDPSWPSNAGGYGVYTGTDTDGTGWYDGNLFDGGRYHNNASYGIHCYKDCGNTIIRNMRVDHNGTTGVLMMYKSGSQIYNVIAHDNQQFAQGVGFDLGGAGLQAYNLTAHNNKNPGIDIRLGEPTVVLRNSISLTGIVNNVGATLSNNITSGSASTYFVDAANGNFQLTPTATAIGVGANLSLVN